MDVYMYIYETRMFELDILESYTNMENINESIGGAISSIIKKIFGTIIKVIKGFFRAIGRLFGLGEGSAESNMSKLDESKTKKDYKLDINMEDIDDIIKNIANDNLLEEDKEEGIKLLQSLLSHPKPTYSKFNKILEALQNPEFYDINSEDYCKKATKMLLPDLDIDFDKIDSKYEIPYGLIVNYLFEVPKQTMSNNDIVKFTELSVKLQKANDGISAKVHKSYKECMSRINELIDKDSEDASAEELKIKNRLNSNMTFILKLTSEAFHQPYKDAITYVNTSKCLFKLFKKKKDADKSNDGKK